MKFIRQDTHKKKRLDKKWRKPRGEHSKLRLRMQGRQIVSPGHGTPKDQKGKHHSGKEIVRVSTLKDIESIDAKKQGAIVSGKLGLRKKLPIVQELIKKKITILNIPDAEGYVKEKQAWLEQRKKKDKPKVKEEKPKEKETIEDTLTEEEKKKAEKEEIDKLLTKKF